MSNLIGTAPDQVPVNGMLGDLAFQDTDSVKVTDLTYTGTLTGSAGILNIGSGQVYKDALGNVGIGTSSPTPTVNYGNLSLGGVSGGQLIFQNGGALNSTIYGNATLLNIGTTGYLAFSSGGTSSERMRINSSGNVGIGTSSPAADTAVTIFNAGTALSGIGLLVRSGYPGYSGVVANILSLRDKDNTTDTFNIKTDGSLSLNHFSAFGTYTNSLTVNASGNVGIGTSSPNNKLDVVGDGQYLAQRGSTTAQAGGGGVWSMASTFWSTPTYTGTGLIQNGSAATGTTLGLANANLGQLVFQNGSAGLIYNNSGSPLVFGTAALERMRIDSSGNVGIGTSSPVRKLDVFSNLMRIGNGNPSYIEFGAYATELNNYLVGVETGSLAFYQGKFGGTVTERMRIDSSGNVVLKTGSLQEVKTALAALDVNISLGNYFTKTITAISTLTVSNVPATGTVASFILDLTNGVLLQSLGGQI